MRKEEGDDLPVDIRTTHNRLMFNCNLFSCCLSGVVNPHQGVPLDVGNKLVTESKDSILVTFLVFMNMDWGNFKRRILFGRNFLTGDAFIVFFDVNHQHM
jgi:hypothetical protein